MFCKYCGNKLNNNVNFCSRCGTKNEIQIVQQIQNTNNNVNKKWKILNTSTISLLILIAIILANVIVYPSDPDDIGQGFIWLFVVLLPSMSLFIVSFVLGIISICQFIKDKKNNINISTFRIIFIILNIIQLLIMAIMVIWIVLWWGGIM